MFFVCFFWLIALWGPKRETKSAHFSAWTEANSGWTLNPVLSRVSHVKAYRELVRVEAKAGLESVEPTRTTYWHTHMQYMLCTSSYTSHFLKKKIALSAQSSMLPGIWIAGYELSISSHQSPSGFYRSHHTCCSLLHWEHKVLSLAFRRLSKSTEVIEPLPPTNPRFAKSQKQRSRRRRGYILTP